MNHTPQIRRAIDFSARKHHGQFRMGNNPPPYVTHPFAVALLVAEDGADDDIVTAALLHDVIEDTGTSRGEIAQAFNERVAALVAEVSEDKSLPWKERKAAYLAQVENGSEGAVRIAIADKIDNLESKLKQFEEEGESFMTRWKQPKEEYLWFNAESLRIAQARLPGHKLTLRLAEAHEREKSVFGRK